MNSRQKRNYDKRLKEYKRLAKKADAQLRQLERYIKLSKMDVYETKVNKKTGKKTKVLTDKYKKYHVLEDYAYNTAMQDIQRLYKGGKRFDRSAAGLSLKELNKRIAAIEDFLGKPSAYIKKTKEHSSIVDAWNRAAEAFSAEITKRLRDSKTIGKDEFINLTPDMIKDLVEEARNQGIIDDDELYRVLQAIATIQRNEDLLEAINDIRSGYSNEELKSKGNRDKMATELKEKMKDLGLGTSESATLSTMIGNGIDFSKFRQL